LRDNLNFKKMDKEKILSQIKEKIGKTNLDDRTITDYITLHLPEGSEPDDKFYERAVGILKSIEGDFSHKVGNTVKEQVAAKIEEFKKNYKPASKEDTPQKTDDALLKRLEALEQAYEKEKKLNMINSLRNEVKSKAESLKVARKPLWEDIVSTIEIPDDATADSLLEIVKPTYEAKLRSYLGDGAVPYQGSQNPPKDDGSQLDEFFAKKVEQGKMPKKE